jgi:formamidopyrimidine-DNA glycosylase
LSFAMEAARQSAFGGLVNFYSLQMMNQKNVSGIGNMYMHDILFKARLHPKKKIWDMNNDEIKLLYNSIIDILSLSRERLLTKVISLGKKEATQWIISLWVIKKISPARLAKRR